MNRFIELLASHRKALLVTMVIAGLSGCGTMDASSKAAPRKELLALKITEIHYHPLDQDTISGDEYEFIEIQNTGTTGLSLTGTGFTTGIEFTFKTGAELAAGKFLVLAVNPIRFKERYGFEPFGAYTGKLSNSGEQISLMDIRGDSLITSVVYSDKLPWPVRADGGGSSLVPAKPDADGALGRDWKASFANHGSPGKPDPVAVLINEVSTHTDLPATDAIELFNPNESSIDLGGWYLSDDLVDLMKFRIPVGTVIPAGSYLVFDSSDFNADPNSPKAFSLSAHGDEVFLSKDSTGCLGFCHGFTYGEIENGMTFGRYVTSTGDEHFIAQKAATLNAGNAGPLVGPIVISEIMYHPANDSDEYLEIANNSSDSVALFDKKFPNNTWKVKGFGFTFPIGITLAPNEVVLILSASTPISAFRIAHGIADSVRIFTAGARLSNDSDTLSLLEPKDPYDDGKGTVVPYKLVEQINYQDEARWPSGPDGNGEALRRKDLRAYGNDPDNWSGTFPSPGRLP
jgi:Lamin Tail Domain